MVLYMGSFDSKALATLLCTVATGYAVSSSAVVRISRQRSPCAQYVYNWIGKQGAGLPLKSRFGNKAIVFTCRHSATYP